MKPARTRFAPSPTGALHCGVVRTALYAWLLAKQSDGQFLLRIEDTDQKREVEGGLENIKETLRWLGLNWDEGPDIGGPYAPYIQSQRLAIYKEYAQELLDKGLAYADPHSKEELEALREKAKAEKRPFLFRDYRPENPPAWDGSQPLRIKLEPKAWSWHDAVMGDVSLGPEMIDDYIIIKADGFPTYNFCHIIDDYLMKITHVMRSQEFISSIPKFLAAHEALGLTPPINATLPQVMDETGRAKLSKRKGAKPVLHYRDQGFLPEAMLDFLATIGWNDGTEQESFTVDELIQKFSLERVHRSGGIFNEQRLVWLNGLHIRKLSLDTLYERSRTFWPAEAAGQDDAYKKSVLALVQERLKFFAELPELTNFFFQDLPLNPALWQDNKQLKKLEPSELRSLLEQGRAALAASDFSVDDLTERLNNLLEQTGQKPGVLFSLIRIATTEAPASPPLAGTLAVLGKDTSLRRIDAMLASLAPAGQS
ncbi:MAG TPA: glutamate--tRNA ligase [Candidatus Saccharimonadales bacterium]|nr:glutamate--tRNA ligase [Candidatus Saccharimonadales bacterium]